MQERRLPPGDNAWIWHLTARGGQSTEELVGTRSPMIVTPLTYPALCTPAEVRICADMGGIVHGHVSECRPSAIHRLMFPRVADWFSAEVAVGISEVPFVTPHVVLT